MSTTPKKEFVLTRVLKDVSSMKENEKRFSEAEEHFGADWKTNSYLQENHLKFYLYCDKPCDTRKWSISTDYEVKILSANGKVASQTTKVTFGNTSEPHALNWGWPQFIPWDTLLKDYLIDDTVTIETRVTILKMTGIEKKKMRHFDETTKELSDVVLVVGAQKFYVSKLFLAGQSSYFKALLMGSFQESEKSEITLTDVDPKVFQNFLEVLHGEQAIDDKTITGILNLADMYDAPTVMRQCEEFLMEKSEKPLKEKIGISAGYNLKKLKNKCLQEIKTVEDIRSVVSGDLTEMDRSVLAALLQKSLSLH